MKAILVWLRAQLPLWVRRAVAIVLAVLIVVSLLQAALWFASAGWNDSSSYEDTPSRILPALWAIPTIYLLFAVGAFTGFWLGLAVGSLLAAVLRTVLGAIGYMLRNTRQRYLMDFVDSSGFSAIIEWSIAAALSATGGYFLSRQPSWAFGWIDDEMRSWIVTAVDYGGFYALVIFAVGLLVFGVLPVALIAVHYLWGDNKAK